MTKILEQINQFIWGIPVLILILGVGIYLSFCTSFAQLTLFPRAVKNFVKRLCKGQGTPDGVSAYQALCTALAATVGTGNLAGVAGAITIGGPGAVFWMWICAILGMVTKYAEATLAVFFRSRNSAGEIVGGPMYMISRGMGKNWTWLGAVYCFLGVVAAFGVGNATQVNAVIGSLNSTLAVAGSKESAAGNLIMGIGLAVLIASVLLGGARRIGALAERLVPFASAAYLLLCTVVLLLRASAISDALHAIVQGAFSPRAVTGGVLGSAFQALRIGASRGVFTNEAGMGTASIAHAAAQVNHPAEQGLMGIIEVFLDTIVICTMTALVILVSGISIPYGSDEGIAVTVQAFSSVLGNWVSALISVMVCCFAIATILGWGLYGARCAQYLFGEKVWKPFVILQAVTAVVGAVLRTQTVWMLAEIVNGLMAIPNLFALIWLSPVLRQLTKEFRKRDLFVYGGTYEDIDQRKPLRTFSHAEIPPIGSGSGEKRKENPPSEYRSA